MSHPFTPSPDDTAIQMLIGIFGPAFAKAAGIEAPAGLAQTSMLSEAFRYFNSGVLFFGAVIVMYVTVMGVVNTANDGEALGKKWSTFYTPVRTFSAAALLMPTSSGYAAIQLLMFYIVAASIAFASNLWKTAATYMLTDEVDNQIISSVVDDRAFETVAASVIRMQVCAHAVEKAVNATNTSGTPIKMRLTPKNEVEEGLYGKEYITTFSYQDPNWPNSKYLCGSLGFHSRYLNQSNSQATLATTSNLQEALNNVQLKLTQDLFGPSGVKPLSDAIIAAVETDSTVKTEDIKKGIISARIKLTDALKKEVSSQIRQMQQPTVDKLTSKGWMWAGSLHLDLARIKDAIKTSTTFKNNFVAGSFSLDSVSSSDLLQAQNQILVPYQNVLNLALNNALRDAQGSLSKTPTLPAFDSGFTLSDFVTGDNAIKTPSQNFLNLLAMALSRALFITSHATIKMSSGKSKTWETTLLSIRKLAW